MKYLSLDLCVINDLDDIKSLTSMAIMFCDTESEKTEFVEFNVLQDEYVVSHEEIGKASESFLSILKKERISCYSENLIHYLSRHLSANGSPEGDRILIVTNHAMERIEIMKEAFSLYEIEVFNIPNFTRNDNKYIDICSLQREYFEKFQKSLK